MPKPKTQMSKHLAAIQETAQANVLDESEQADFMEEFCNGVSFLTPMQVAKKMRLDVTKLANTLRSCIGFRDAMNSQMHMRQMELGAKLQSRAMQLADDDDIKAVKAAVGIFKTIGEATRASSPVVTVHENAGRGMIEEDDPEDDISDIMEPLE